MPLVLDASITITWCFEDEASPLGDAVLDSLTDDYAVVPSLWRLEVANVLLVAERRGRLALAQSERFLTLLGGLPIRSDDSGTMSDALASGRQHGLSAYDAAYLTTAAKLGLPLATSDKALGAAATAAGVERFMTAR